MKMIREENLVIDLAEENQNFTGNQTVDKFEHKAAMRTAMNLRTLLYEDAMLKLVAPQLEKSYSVNKKYCDDSNGEFNYGHLVLEVSGLNVQEFMGTLRAVYAVNEGSDDEKGKKAAELFFASHPEHYASSGGCIELMGGLPTFTKPVPMPIEQAPDFVKKFEDESFSVRTAGQGPLKDDTPFTYVLQQYKDISNGMTADLYIWYPSACPDNYVEEHIEHYAVEFRNGCKLTKKHK